MIKQLAFIAGLALFSLNVLAQAYEGKIKFEKTDEPAIAMVYDYPQAIVENALIAKLADKELTGVVNKENFRQYLNAVIPDISKSKLDYSFKLENSGAGNQEKTTVYMVMQGSGNIEGVDQLATRGKSFLEGMLNDVKRSNTIVEIKKQEQVLADEESKLLVLKKEQTDMEARLQENKSKQATQEKIVASQKAILQDLKKAEN